MRRMFGEYSPVSFLLFNIHFQVPGGLVSQQDAQVTKIISCGPGDEGVA